jgi:hypothetical protein
MNKLELLKKLIEKAKDNGYEGPDYSCEIGRIIDGTNAYALFFREDFAIAIWGSSCVHVDAGSGLHSSSKDIPLWKIAITKMVTENDKWEFLKNNVNFN